MTFSIGELFRDLKFDLTTAVHITRQEFPFASGEYGKFDESDECGEFAKFVYSLKELPTKGACVLRGQRLVWRRMRSSSVQRSRGVFVMPSVSGEGKRGMSLRNGIIMRDVIYPE